VVYIAAQNILLNGIICVCTLLKRPHPVVV
jgi:hypothetical protein